MYFLNEESRDVYFFYISPENDIQVCLANISYKQGCLSSVGEMNSLSAITLTVPSTPCLFLSRPDLRKKFLGTNKEMRAYLLADSPGIHQQLDFKGCEVKVRPNSPEQNPPILHILHILGKGGNVLNVL